MKIGYARVSTAGQTLDSQRDQLERAGCEMIVEEHASGGDRDRPELRRLMENIRRGDMLVVTRIDRLARSLSHLLAILEQVEARGASFRSLGDPIDTATPQGRFAMQLLGAAAEFERALVKERTLAGLAAARSRGKLGGNPGLRRRDPNAIKSLAERRKRNGVMRLAAEAEDWLPIVRKMRPYARWKDVASAIARETGHRMNEATLRRRCATLAREGLLDRALMRAAPRRATNEEAHRMALALKGANPNLTLREIGERMLSVGIAPPRGGAKWNPDSVRRLLVSRRAAPQRTSEAPSLHLPPSEDQHGAIENQRDDDNP